MEVLSLSLTEDAEEGWLRKIWGADELVWLWGVAAWGVWSNGDAGSCSKAGSITSPAIKWLTIVPLLHSSGSRSDGRSTCRRLFVHHQCRSGTCSGIPFIPWWRQGQLWDFPQATLTFCVAAPPSTLRRHVHMFAL